MAGKSDPNVRALIDQAETTPNLEVTLRACRYPNRVKQWKALPAEAFTIYEERGVCVGARPKELRVAETRTVLKEEDPDKAVRTIVCRQVSSGPKKDRWHPLYTSSEAEAGKVVDDFRLRQHHEQGFRVQVHDEFLNAVPCGYDKQSPRPPATEVPSGSAATDGMAGRPGLQRLCRLRRKHLPRLRRQVHRDTATHLL